MSKSESEIAKDKRIQELESALRKIVEYVHPHRTRGWHIYPTRLRDDAVYTLGDVKPYTQCEHETKEVLAQDIARSL